jgi:hypothetical protein
MTVETLTYNVKGQVTAKETKTITLPNSPLKVDGLSPDTTTDRNVKLTYIYDTETAFNAAKNSIPAGARVIKMWE